MKKFLPKKGQLLKASFLALLSTPFVSASAQNTALDFDGTNDYIETTYQGISGNGSRTVEAWIKSSYDAAQRFIVDMGDTGAGAGARFSFKINPGANAVRIEIGGAGINGTTYINNNQWHHVAVVYDNAASTNKYKIYVDGELDVQGDMTTPLNVLPAATHLCIGIRADLSLSTVFDGGIDDVRVWDVARTQAEIQANMNTEYCGAQAGLVSYHKLNEGIAGGSNTAITTVSDSSGNGYTGTLHDFSLTGTGSNFIAGPTSLAAEVIDATVSLTDATITATATGATYQWVDCDNSNAIIDGETAQSFTATESGNYAVIISNGGCSVTSACTAVTVEADVCEVPTAIVFTEITETTVTLSWTENGDATEWEVIYGAPGFDPLTEGMMAEATITPLVTLNSLTADTQYDVYVYAVCSDDESSEGSTVTTFTTEEEIIVVPGSEVALHFDATGDYIQTNYPGVLGNTARTIEAWVNTESLNNEQIIATWGSDAITGGRFTFRLNASGSNDVIRIENKGGGINGTVNINDGNWHHVAVTYDNNATPNKYKLYVDGVLDTQGNIATPTNTIANTNMIIGRRIVESFGGYYTGSMDEHRVWSVARTQEELAANMNTEFCSPQANLESYFKFNDGTPDADNTSVTILTDSSGNGYEGNIMGFTLTGTDSNFSTGIVAPSTELDNAVTLAEGTLTATEEGAAYQWINCGNGNEEIDGATAQMFTPTETGSYAVIITSGGCNVISECIEVTIGGTVCETPSAVVISEIENTTATVTWTENGDAAAWQVLYGETGFDPLTEGTTVDATVTPTAMLTELTAGTAYDVYVIAVCGDEDNSEWSAVATFTTEMCEAPTEVTISDITNTTATVTWTENGDAAAWQVLYGAAGFDPLTEGTTLDATVTPTAMLTELTSGAAYDVYVIAVCGDEDNSEWSAVVTFTTEICEAVTDVTVADITDESAAISWTENGDATQWEVLYGAAGFDPLTEGTTVPVTTDPATTLTELTADTQYDVYIRAVCGDEDNSEWTGPMQFTTETLSVKHNAIQGFMMYPNPTSGTIKISAASTINSIAIVNLTGQTVMQTEVNAVASEINLSQLPSGVYLMQVSANGKRGSYKLIRE